MEALELIKTAYLIDQNLERLATSLADEALKKTILSFQSEWQETAYLITKLTCGIENGNVSETQKKRVSRKKSGAGDEEPRRAEESQVPTDAEEQTWPKSS